MKARVSPLMRKILADPQGSEELRAFITSNRTEATIHMSDGSEHRITTMSTRPKEDELDYTDVKLSHTGAVSRDPSTLRDKINEMIRFFKRRK